MSLLEDATALYFNGTQATAAYLNGAQVWNPLPTTAPGGTFVYTPGTFLDAYTQRDGVTTTDATDVATMVWQLFYSHQQVQLPLGPGNIGITTYDNNYNTWTWYFTCTYGDSIGNWQVPFAVSDTWNQLYYAGNFNTSTITTGVTIPANRYFMLGTLNGPYQKAIKGLSSNRVALVNNSPYITVINRVFLGGLGTASIPNQVGGNDIHFTEYSSHALVMSAKFN